MRIAVVYPEVLDMARYRDLRKEFPPFGALYIAAAIESASHEVTILKLSPGNTKHDLTPFDVVAFSISASATFNLFLECRLKRTFNDQTLIIAGGVHANLFPEQTLVDLNVHAVGIGEGEDTILELINQKYSRNFSHIAGICYFDGMKTKRTAPRTLSKNIDRFRLPARHLIPVEDFVMNDRMSNTSVRMTHIMPGRGCPFPCRYCASAQTKVQYRSGSNLEYELRHLIEKYAVEGFAVVGNDFILNKNNVFEICSAIRPLQLQWATLSRVDRVDPEILGAMRAAGCYEIEFGVESGSQRILDAMDKRASIEQVQYALRKTFEAGIKNKVFLVHGYPGENLNSTLETINLLETAGKWIERVSLFRFVPLPGTYVYNNWEELNIRGVPGSSTWDGDWGRFHIHHNHHHWWGDDRDFARLTDAYKILRDYVENRWPSKISIENLPPDRWAQQSQSFVRELVGLKLDNGTDKERIAASMA